MQCCESYLNTKYKHCRYEDMSFWSSTGLWQAVGSLVRFRSTLDKRDFTDSAAQEAKGMFCVETQVTHLVTGMDGHIVVLGAGGGGSSESAFCQKKKKKLFFCTLLCMLGWNV